MSLEHSPARQGRHAGSPRFDHSTGQGPPRWGRIPAAEARSGLKRRKLYHLAAANPGLFKKVGAATIVDLWKLDDIIAAAPEADVSGSSADRQEKAGE